MEPTRTTPRPTRCVCRLRLGNSQQWDSCQGHTSGPDEPVCRDCTNAGHHEAHNFDPIIKDARTP
jgi:hypothetical protein